MGRGWWRNIVTKDGKCSSCGFGRRGSDISEMCKLKVKAGGVGFANWGINLLISGLTGEKKGSFPVGAINLGGDL